MYDKIAQIANRDYGCSDLSSEDVEGYLRNGDMRYISAEEADIIEVLLERYR